MDGAPSLRGTLPGAARSRELRWLARPDLPRKVAAVALVAIVALLALGITTFLGLDARAFDLDEEKTVPAAFSALLLVAAGFVSAEAGRLGRGRERAGLLLLGALLAFLAVDEAFVIHERLERLTHVQWHVLYLPVAAAVGVGWWLTLRLARREGVGSRLLLGGAACWLASQVIEHFSLGGDASVSYAEYLRRSIETDYRIMIVAEEMFEMLGSLLFLLAFLFLVQRLLPSRPSSSRV